MFCRKCGKTLLDGDRFCSYCGAQVIERNDSISGDEHEEVVYNSAPKPIKETLGAGLPKKSIAQSWHDISENNTEKPPTWNLKGYPSHTEDVKKTEDIVVDWSARRIEEREKASESIRPTFTRKDLLERDKTRIFDKKKIDQNLEEEDEVSQPVQEESFSTFDLETELFGKKQNLQFGPMGMGQASTGDSIDKFYTFSKKNEEFQKLLDKEYERLKKGRLESIDAPNLGNLEIKPVEEGAETGLGKLFSETTMGQASNLTVQPIKEEEINQELENPFWSKVIVHEKAEIEKETSEITPEKQVPTEEQIPIVEKSEETKIAELNGEEDGKNSTEGVAKEITEEPKVEAVVLPWDEAYPPMQAFVDEDANRKKASPVKVFLIILIVLILAEIGILGIKYFLPNSGAATFINERLGIAANWVDLLTKQEDSEKPEKQSVKSTDEEVKQVNAPVKTEQERDLNDVLKSLLVYNDNIKKISINDTLVYDAKKDYENDDLNQSVPISENVWYQDKEGKDVCYDSEIMKTVIRFDSLWIDYLNQKNNDILKMTKEKSKAYYYVKNYTKVGKISETFNSLELGEMRKGENTYYIWVHENYDVTEKGQTGKRNYDYVYYLEPVGQELKIVDYKKIN